MDSSTSSHHDFKTFKQLYESVRKGERAKVVELHSKIPAHPTRPLTVSQDTVLHIAIYMKRGDIAREILANIKHDKDLLTTRNVLGDTVLHEAAATGMTELAKEMLRLAPELLSINNNLGETPLFTAAHYGQAEMFNLLADLVDQKGPEFRNHHLSRRDSTTILHITILAEFFELAYVIAERYPTLVYEKDDSGMIGLQLLSSNPAAFMSGRNHGLLKRLIYHCIPSEDHPGQAQNQEDVGGHELGLIGEVLRKINVWIWNILREAWPMMRELYDEYKRHKSAFRLAKLLIAQDTSWEVCIAKEDRGKISVGNFDDPPESRHKSKEEEDGDDDDDDDDGKAKKGRGNKQRKAKNLHKNPALAGETEPTTDQLKQNTQPNPADMINSSAEATDGAFSVFVKDEPEDLNAPESEKGEPGLGEGLPNPMLTDDTNTSNVESSTTTNKGTKEGSTSTSGKAEQNKTRSPSHLTSLLIAASTGIVEIVKEILRVYPQAVEHVSDIGQNILHVAIKHRQLEIFRRVKKMQLPMSRLVRRIDDHGYTILHHVGVMSYYTGGTLPGPALQLQEELHWFERVRKIIPQHYEMHRSSFGDKRETADEFFRRTHEKLLKEAQEWLKRTSESCSAVAVLIATVAFAAAYTVPGGSDQETGIPVLLHDPFFLVFTVMDVLSLASSLTSVVMFLSILTSPFELKDFHRALPRKLILAFTFLFFSVAVTMLAFAATIVLIIHLKNRWTTSIIYTLAFLPVTVFALLQFPLYLAFMDTMKSTLKVIKRALPWYAIPRWIKATFCPNIKND